MIMGHGGCWAKGTDSTDPRWPFPAALHYAPRPACVPSSPGPSTPLTFYAPRFLFVELFKHKDRLAVAAKVSEGELLESLHVLVSRMEFVNEANIPLGIWMEAYRLCREIDAKDTAYVALALHLDGRLWTHDDELKIGLRSRGFDRFFEAQGN